MEDFEYSVEISDRDWQCFFTQCEECNLLPPSLAGVDSSGMSDLDDTASMLAKRVPMVNLTAGFVEANHPIDGPPDCEGPPVEHYLSKHGIGGMESVLSGSEEDIHLQCVNIFFEKLKNLTEAESCAAASQVRAEKNREAIQVEQQCNDEQQASIKTLPKNTPNLKLLSAKGEAAVGKETVRPVNTISNINTMKNVELGFMVSLEPAASNSVPEINKSSYPELQLFNKEEVCTETRQHKVTQDVQLHDSPEKVICSEETLSTDKVMTVDMCTPPDDVKQEYLSTFSKNFNTDLLSNLEMLTNVKWKDEQNPTILQLDLTRTNRTRSQESSPSASIKRKRRKKRRLSAEPVESGHGYERHLLVKQRTEDSEDEQYSWRGAVGKSEDIGLFYSHERQQDAMSSIYSIKSNAARIAAKETNLSHSTPPYVGQYQNLPDGIVGPERCTSKGFAEIHVTNSSQSLSQTDDSVMTANVVKPYMKLQEEKLTGLNKYCWLPHSVTPSLAGSGNVESLQQSNDVNHCNTGCESEQNVKCCTSEVKSVTHIILPNADSKVPAVEISQKDKLSAAQSVLAADEGNSGRDKHIVCQREAEHQQQLEIETDQFSSTPGKTDLPPTVASMINADTHNTDTQQFKTRACTSSDDIFSRATSGDCINLCPDRCYLSKTPSSLVMNNIIQKTEQPLQVHTLSKSKNLSENNTPAEKALSEPSQTSHSRNSCPNGDIISRRQSEPKLSMSEDLLTSPSEVTPGSSFSTLDTESVLSNESITDMSRSICSSVCQSETNGGQGEKKSLILAKHMEKQVTFGPKTPIISNNSTESKCDLLSGAEDAIKASKAEPEEALESKHSVFTMSSFWNEMEKLTINDILGLRMIDTTTPPSSLSPLQEEEMFDEMFAMTDSDLFLQLDESKTEQTNENMVNVPDSVVALDSSSSRGVLWESESVPACQSSDIYPDNFMLTCVSDIAQSVIPGSAQKCLRTISKNISVHNLHALESESFSSSWKRQTLPTVEEGVPVEHFTDGHVPKKENVDSKSLTGSNRTSLMGIFQYFFGREQSVPNQSPPDDIATFSIEGNSVPETYDNFFSEFDTESFFCPLFTADEQLKDNLVPIFSCSRSANRNLQFPEAYDYFFASSSSDTSSAESDEEDNCGPVKVVTRLSCTSSTSEISADNYEHFFTDKDLRQNFFWKETLSFRNINFTGSTVKEETLSNALSVIPVRQSDRSLPRRVCLSNVLGNQDGVFPDPLLYHLEDRIARQLAQQPFRFEDLQAAVSNPRLDASFLPLRQSDMCLICIAFASWVLKTANPQVGDTWKAVLLANISALSAIRYLRKHVKAEAADSEKKLHHALTFDG